MLKYFTENVKVYGHTTAMELFLNNFEPYEREPIKNVIELIKREPKNETAIKTEGEN
jgi:hypothetical protein